MRYISKGLFGPTPPHKKGEIPKVPHCSHCDGFVWLYNGVGYVSLEAALEARAKRKKRT